MDKISIPHDAEVEKFLKYRDDPVGFCREVLGVESETRRSDGTPYQFEVLQDLADFDRVGVRSGHGTGKTCADAWAILWFLLTRPLSRVVVLAPEFTRQVKAVIFSECRMWVNRAKMDLPLEVLASKVRVHGAGDEWSAQGMSSGGDPSRIEGWHAQGGLLLIVDEMKGVSADAFDAVQGALTGEDAKVMVTSVPGGAGVGPFWNIFEKGKKRWKLHHFSSVDSTRVTKEWVEEHTEMWGRGTPLFETRVEGNFADVGEGVLFPIHLIERSQQNVLEAGKDVTLGVDVARSVAGDLNAIAVARGGKIDRIITFHEADTMKVVERVVRTVSETGAKLIRVDVGGVGAGVVDRLKELRHKVEAVPFNGRANEPERFKNVRAEMYWNLRERMELEHGDKNGVSLPNKPPMSELLLADLSAQRYEFTLSGQIQLEGKDDTRKRAGHSPDRSDAVALAVGTSRRKKRVIMGVPGGGTQDSHWHGLDAA